MALASIIRKSTCKLAPLANRIIRASQRNYIRAITKPTIVPFIQQNYATATDSNKPSASESLLRVIDSEIKIAQETDDLDRVEAIPQGFPFKIVDNPGQQTIILTREYDGELVKVEVHMPDLVTGEDNEVDDGTDDVEKPTQSSIPLFVTVSKNNGTSLEFHCVAYPDEIAIESLSVKNPELFEDQIAYEGPNYHDLDENLKNAFHKYLLNRGIKPSTTNFLHEYMINKDSREFIGWLKDLKKFIEA
ncbi:uncharacterized protein At2g39795, mitochondrial [Ricinus communis]|uniref:Mitochondrial glycoprotein n=1 Tax=Ricinus communis TaxID=3988 RepID=B9SE10_RICCO|nr:uncharacterized protein At2g39795, mitochondrial [Ricinus communis]EEF38153.1 conserved hypothetical protein [Ricinus communis]|eukprot:XP_002524229.1 uncharacterized protein At2g39795, mitochondrial [Ricinus communis]